jgi:hypothetical protein
MRDHRWSESLAAASLSNLSFRLDSSTSERPQLIYSLNNELEPYKSARLGKNNRTTTVSTLNSKCAIQSGLLKAGTKQVSYTVLKPAFHPFIQYPTSLPSRTFTSHLVLLPSVAGLPPGNANGRSNKLPLTAAGDSYVTYKERPNTAKMTVITGLWIQITTHDLPPIVPRPPLLRQSAPWYNEPKRVPSSRPEEPPPKTNAHVFVITLPAKRDRHCIHADVGTHNGWEGSRRHHNTRRQYHARPSPAPQNNLLRKVSRNCSSRGVFKVIRT